MCLEFLCSWCHQEEDGPDHHRPSHPPRLPPPSNPRSENSDKYPGRHDSPSNPRSEMSSNDTNTRNGDTYSARHDPTSKPHSELYRGNKNQVVSGVAGNGDTKPKAENSKTSSTVFNGEDLKAVHPKPSALAPQVAKSTTVGAQRNGHMQKDEEEDDDDDEEEEEEEEEVSKAAQTKNRRY